MQDWIREVAAISTTSGILSALLYIMSPVRHNWKEGGSAMMIAIASAPVYDRVFTALGWQSELSIISAILAGAVTHFFLYGSLVMLVKFKRNPLSLLRDLKK